MNCKNCKKHGCSLAGKNHEMSFECKAYIGKTNADRIRSMTDEELAEFLGKVTADGYGMCAPGSYDCEGKDSCAPCWFDWLKQEVNDGRN